MSYEAYQADAKTRLAVERCIEIIAEADRRLPTAIHASYSAIPWDDIERHLAPLEKTLGAIGRDHDIDLNG